MPDNGFGNKANSRSFLLRVYRVRPKWRTGSGGEGTVEVLDAITLSDPDAKVPFPIVNESTDERLLTGGDFDVESLRIARDGTLWFGDEFGPFLLHTDADGRVGRTGAAAARLLARQPVPLRPPAQPRELERIRGDGALKRPPNPLSHSRGTAPR